MDMSSRPTCCTPEQTDTYLVKMNKHEVLMNIEIYISTLLTRYCFCKFLSANWDGIYDNETGLLGYSVTAGEKICEEKIKAHHDPHAHLLDESQWTNSVMMTPLEAPYTVLPGILSDYKTPMGRVNI